MNLHQTIQQATAGATFMGWLAVNATAVTAGAVGLTAIASIVFGVMDKMNKSKMRKISEESNRLHDEQIRTNRRDIVDSIFDELELAGKSKEYIDDLASTLRKR